MNARQDLMPASDVFEVTQCLTFFLDDDVIGIDLKKIKEVLEIKDITLLPRTPDFMRGVINLRGQVIPIVDLKLKFGMKKTEFTVDTCIIIIEANIGDESIVMGALADSVRNVADFSDSNREPVPRMGSGIDSKFVACMVRHEDEFFSFLDLNSLFSTEELLMGTATKPVSSTIT